MNGKVLSLFAVLFSIVVAPVADARDTRHKFAITAAMAKSEAGGKVPSGIKFYFGDQKYAKPSKTFGEARTNRKTNFFNKSDQEGCEWAFYSAMIALGERAKSLGANAVVNIRSNYKNQEFKSDTEYECGAGATTGGVAFIAEIVTLP